LKPEEEARKKIDVLLEKAGWVLQDYKDLNLGAGVGIDQFGVQGTEDRSLVTQFRQVYLDRPL
jgi:hypothetical protein